MTGREFEPDSRQFLFWTKLDPALPLDTVVQVQVAADAGFLTTTARAVAQYCKFEPEVDGAASGNAIAALSFVVLSRFVTVTISRDAAEVAGFTGRPEALAIVSLARLKVGVIDTDESISCIFRFRDLVIGPILVIDTLLLELAI